MTDLHQLVGLSLPDSVSWWPLAPGWYILFALLICIVAFLAYQRRVKYIKNSYRRTALSQVETLSFDNGDHLLPILQTAINHTADTPIELQKEVFLSHLNKGTKNVTFDEQDWQLLTTLAFQPSRHGTELETQFSTLKVKCQQWIKAHHYEY